MLSDFASVALSPPMRLLLFESSSGTVLDQTDDHKLGACRIYSLKAIAPPVGLLIAGKLDQ